MSFFPQPTDPITGDTPEFERERWSRMFASEDYVYGLDAGLLARRAVRYHRCLLPEGGTALDAGCGEGQDVAFFAAQGYATTGVDFIPDGLAKARQLLAERGLRAHLIEADLRGFAPQETFDLVLALNSLQFLGQDAWPCLDRLKAAVVPGGVIAISLFAREENQAEIEGTLFFTTIAALLERFAHWQPLEASQLWQWNLETGRVGPFVTLIARNAPPSRPVQGSG